jgi:hypothetical protein
MEVTHRLYAPIALKNGGGGGNKIIFESAKLSAHSLNTSTVHLVMPIVCGRFYYSVDMTYFRMSW